MSTEGLLGRKKLNKIHVMTGINPVRGWANYPYWEFRDAQDRHFKMDIRSGGWFEIPNPWHYTSCRSDQA